MIKRNLIKRNYEVWKPIKGFSDYEISCFGRVKSLQRHVFRTNTRKYLINESILKGSIGKDDYHKITLCKDKKMYYQRINILVLSHFGPPKPSPKHECNHIDGNKQNNWWINLEWMTTQENTQHAYDTGLAVGPLGQINGAVKLTEKQVKDIREEYMPHKMTAGLLSKKYKVSQSSIRNIISGRTWGWLS